MVEAQVRGSLHFHGMLWAWVFMDSKTFKKSLNEECFKENFISYLNTIIKCDFEDFQSSESEFQNPYDVDSIHPCCTSSYYIETHNISENTIKSFNQDVIDIGMSAVIHKCGVTCFKNFKHNGCRLCFGYDNERKQLLDETIIE
jgi:hypothetical protein